MDKTCRNLIESLILFCETIFLGLTAQGITNLLECLENFHAKAIKIESYDERFLKTFKT